MAVKLIWTGCAAATGPGRVWIRVLKDPALLVLSRDDVHRVLGGSPDPFASDPEAKRKGMVTFQPDALTLSRDGAWENRRRFTEAVLDTGRPLHRLADRFAAVAREEGEALLRACRGVGGELDWEPWHRAFRLTTRRVVLGDSARDDEELSELLAELMSEANKMPGKPSDRLDAFMGRLRHYVAAGEEGSLVSLFGEAPFDDATKVEGQIPHWLFAMQDTLAINSLRCLALLGSHPRQLGEARAELEGGGRAGQRGGSRVAELSRRVPGGGHAALAHHADALEADDRRRRLGRRVGPGRHAGGDRQHLPPPRPREPRLRRPLRARGVDEWRGGGGLVVQPPQPWPAGLPGQRAGAVRGQGDPGDGARRAPATAGGAADRPGPPAAAHARLLLRFGWRSSRPAELGHPSRPWPRPPPPVRP